MQDATVKWLSTLHTWLFRASRGLIGGRLGTNDMLLLTTTGRATGRPHTVPLLYLRDGDRIVVIASYGGRPRHPEWFHNLVASPAVSIQLPGSRHRATARVAGPDERDQWWPRIEAAYSGYAEYQSRTDRQIPVIVLEPFGAL